MHEHHDEHSMNGGMNMLDMSGHMMQYLQFRTTASILVPEWSTGSIYGLILAMLAAVTAAVTFECIQSYHTHLTDKALQRSRQQENSSANLTCCERLLLSCLSMVRILLGYFMMLCVMTMNIWIIISVVLGATLGYGLGKPLMAMSLDKPSPESRNPYTDNTAASRSRSWRFKGFTVDQSVSLLEEEEEQFMRGAKAKSPRPPLNMRYSKDRIYIVQPKLDESASELLNESYDKEQGDTNDKRTSNLDQPDVVMRTPRKNGSTSSSLPSSPTSTGRFRSTSKVISNSFKGDSLRSSRKSSEGGSSTDGVHSSSSRFRSTSRVISLERT